MGAWGGGPKWPTCPSWLSDSHLLQSEKLLLYDTLQGELQERIQRLEEDRQSLDISSGEARVRLGQGSGRPQAPSPGLTVGAHSCPDLSFPVCSRGSETVAVGAE